MADTGADPAFVASPSSQQVVSTEGFNRGESECPFDSGKDRDSFFAWHRGFIAGLKHANEIWGRALTAQSTGEHQ